MKKGLAYLHLQSGIYNCNFCIKNIANYFFNNTSTSQNLRIVLLGALGVLPGSLIVQPRGIVVLLDALIVLLAVSIVLLRALVVQLKIYYALFWSLVVLFGGLVVSPNHLQVLLGWLIVLLFGLVVSKSFFRLLGILVLIICQVKTINNYCLKYIKIKFSLVEVGETLVILTPASHYL